MDLILTPEEKRAVLLIMGSGAKGGGSFAYDEAALKKAYRCKVKTSHPDLALSLGKDPILMKNQFQELNQAFQLLLERIRRDNTDYAKRVYRKSRPGAYKPTAQSTRKQGEKSRNTRTGTKTGKTYKSTQSTRASHNRKRSAPSSSPEGKLYKGPIPERILRFAEYLYYTGEISWEDMVHALVWQYRNRPKLGELAEQLGVLGQKEVLFIIRNRDFAERFGDAAVRLGFLDKRDVDKLIRRQKLIGLPIGKYFQEQKGFSEDRLIRKLQANRRHNLLQQE